MSTSQKKIHGHSLLKLFTMETITISSLHVLTIKTGTMILRQFDYFFYMCSLSFYIVFTIEKNDEFYIWAASVGGMLEICSSAAWFLSRTSPYHPPEGVGRDF